MSLFADKTCRLCATAADTNQPIFTESAADESGLRQLTSVAHMMDDCLFDEIHPDSGYPEFVCQFCQLQLNVFYEFKKKVLQHHRAFTELLHKNRNLSYEDDKASSSVPSTTESPLRSDDEKDDDAIESPRPESPPLSPSSELLESPGNLYQTTLKLECVQKHEEEDCADIDEEDVQVNDDEIDGTLEEQYLDDSDLKDEHIHRTPSTPPELADDALSIHSLSDPDDLDSMSKALSTEVLDDLDDEEVLEANDHSEEMKQEEEVEQEEEQGRQSPDSALYPAKFVKAEIDDHENLEMLVEYIDDDEQDDEEDDDDDKDHIDLDDDERAAEETASAADPIAALLNLHKQVDWMQRIEAQTVHVTRHGQRVEAFECTECDEIVGTRHEFVKHVNKSHRQRVRCKQCGQAMFSDYIRKHMLLHRPVQPHSCALCGKGFMTVQQRDDHEFRHTDERPLQCDLCSKRFKLKCDLRVHMAGHSRLRRFECDLCDKAFRQRSHLIDHRQTHNTQRSIPCELCAMMFKTTVTLRSHVRQMHAQGAHEFVCAECGRGFFRRFKLLKHMATHKRAQDGAKDLEED